MKYYITLMLTWGALVTMVYAQEQELPPSKPITSAREAVHQGNVLLLEDNAAGALVAYREAEKLDPEAVEIPFVTGLGHFKLGEYEQARGAFQKAATSSDEKLAHDALYSVGTTYHAEALANMEDPKASVEKLEHAMQRYRTVLADIPEHEAARDANLKAASMRRKLVQMMQEQEKQECDNPQPSDEEKESDEEQEKNENSDDQQEESEEQKEQDQQQSQDEEEKEQQQSDQGDEQEKDEEQQQSEQSEQNEDEKQKEDAQQQLAEQQEQNTQEQAQRRLREMMQAIRDREKNRREPVERIPVQPVEKDW